MSQAASNTSTQGQQPSTQMTEPHKRLLHNLAECTCCMHQAHHAAATHRTPTPQSRVAAHRVFVEEHYSIHWDCMHVFHVFDVCLNPTQQTGQAGLSLPAAGASASVCPPAQAGCPTQSRGSGAQLRQQTAAPPTPPAGTEQQAVYTVNSTARQSRNTRAGAGPANLCR
jgi:hypothetical protein